MSTGAFTPWARRPSRSPGPADYAGPMAERWLRSEGNVRICAVLGAVAIAFSSILVRLSPPAPASASALSRST